MAMQEECFSLGENSNHIVTVTPFNTELKVHIRQFYVNENEEIASRIGVTLSVEEFNELVKLISQVQESIARYEMRDTGFSTSPSHSRFGYGFLTISAILFQSLKTSNFWIVNPNFLHYHHLLLPMYHHHSSTLLLKRL